MTVPWQTAFGAVLLSGERKWLKNAASRAAKQFKSPVIVNIGVFQYASMYCLRAGAPEARLVGVDVTKGSVKVHPELQAEFTWGDSRVVHTVFKAPIHLLFIDGDHRYATVKADIANWVSKIVPGGVVAFHDYAPLRKHLVKHKLQGIRRAVNEWAAKAKWKRLPAVGSLAAFQRPG